MSASQGRSVHHVVVLPMRPARWGQCPRRGPQADTTSRAVSPRAHAAGKRAQGENTGACDAEQSFHEQYT